MSEQEPRGNTGCKADRISSAVEGAGEDDYGTGIRGMEMVQTESKYKKSRMSAVTINLHQPVCSDTVQFYRQGEKETRVFGGKFLEKWGTLKEDGGYALMVGTGDGKEPERGMVREICATAAKEMKERKIQSFSCDMQLILSLFGTDALQEAAEGIVLGLYSMEKFSGDEEKNWQVTFINVPEDENTLRLVEEGRTLAGAVIFARDMVNRPANYLRPLDFAAEAVSLLEGLPVEVQVLDLDQIREEKMGAFLAVGESSLYPPCMLVMRYMPKKDGEITALVGKGVMCDTGGYCLKDSKYMEGIKGDMAGGAAVIGAVYAMAKADVPNNVVGIVPMCENRISPGSMIPGDVVTAGNGMTIEILNTDAEGRLILADAVSFAVRKEGAKRVVDIATLTGAMGQMLGNSITGLLTDNDEFCEEFMAAAADTGERYHRLPWYKEHEEMIKSDVADVKNSGVPFCPSITAGLFIRRFAEEKPWIHLDIAGSACAGKPVFAYQEGGATGVGVMTLYTLCKGQK